MNSMTRRQFISKSTTATVAASALLGRSPVASANSKVNIAAIGIGGMGNSNLRPLGEHGQNIVALCDLDHTYAARTFNAFPKAKRYKDYRVMLEKQKDIDAVVIATPDHTHAVITMDCLKAGKHVYTQKPLTHDVFEARKLAQAADKMGLVTQMGIQGHSADGGRQVVEWIQSGVIGDVTEVDAWCSLSYYPWGHASWSSPLGARPTDTPAIPNGFDWDLWLGPAPFRPYHPTYHPRTWRSWLDFGCGMMGDRGAHTFDPICWALNLGHPDTLEASSMGGDDEIHPLSSVVRYTYPKRGSMPPVTINWYEGLTPPRPSDLDDKEVLGNVEGGSLFKGSKGYITCGVYGENPRLLPEARMKDFKAPEPFLPRINMPHEMDWVTAIQNGTKANADFSYSGPLTETVLLGNIAKRLNTRIRWDGEAMRFTNNDEATHYVQTEYRKGWSL